MTTPSSVPAADRTPAADSTRHAPGRRSNGGERFGAALSAELGNRSARDDRSPDRVKRPGADRTKPARRRAADDDQTAHGATANQATPGPATMAAGVQATQAANATPAPDADAAQPGARVGQSAATAAPQDGTSASGNPTALADHGVIRTEADISPAEAHDHGGGMAPGSAVAGQGPALSPTAAHAWLADPATPADSAQGQPNQSIAATGPGQGQASQPSGGVGPGQGQASQSSGAAGPGQNQASIATGPVQGQPSAATGPGQGQTGQPNAAADPTQGQSTGAVGGRGQGQAGQSSAAADPIQGQTGQRSAADPTQGQTGQPSAAADPTQGQTGQTNAPSGPGQGQTGQPNTASAGARTGRHGTGSASSDASGTMPDATAGTVQPTKTGEDRPAEGPLLPDIPGARDAAPAVPDHVFAGVAGPAPAARATAPAAPPPAPSAAPPAAQVAMQIVPLRLEADGVHRLTVHLHPVDLGPVQVVAEIRNGDVTLQLSGGTDAGTAALRDSLDDLRRELTASGFGNCSLDLQNGGEQARQPYSQGRPSTGGIPAATPAPAPIPELARHSAGRLDVRA